MTATISDADTKSGTAASSATWTITYPTNIAAGDLLVLWLAASSSFTATTGMTTLLLNAKTGTGGAACLGVYAAVATGSETGTFSVTMSLTTPGAWRMWRITNWYGGSLSAGTTTNASTGVSGATAIAQSTTPDPPSRSPAWGSDDNLWIAACAANGGTSNTLSGYPASYSDTSTDGPSASPIYLGLATRALTTGTEDPGTFTTTVNRGWAAATLVIRPASSTTNAPAGNASGTLTASSPSLSISPNAGNASATITAPASAVAVKPSAGNAAITIAAQNGSARVAPSAALGSVMFAAYNPSVTISVPLNAATATVAAFDGSALVMISPSTATITGTAYDASAATGTVIYGYADLSVAPLAGMSVADRLSAHAALTHASGGAALAGTLRADVTATDRVMANITTDVEVLP